MIYGHVVVWISSSTGIYVFKYICEVYRNITFETLDYIPDRIYFFCYFFFSNTSGSLWIERHRRRGNYCRMCGVGDQMGIKEIQRSV